jgi:hypothetical protein
MLQLIMWTIVEECLLEAALWEEPIDFLIAGETLPIDEALPGFVGK